MASSRFSGFDSNIHGDSTKKIDSSLQANKDDDKVISIPLYHANNQKTIIPSKDAPSFWMQCSWAKEGGQKRNGSQWKEKVHLLHKITDNTKTLNTAYIHRQVPHPNPFKSTLGGTWSLTRSRTLSLRYHHGHRTKDSLYAWADRDLKEDQVRTLSMLLCTVLAVDPE